MRPHCEFSQLHWMLPNEIGMFWTNCPGNSQMSYFSNNEPHESAFVVVGVGGDGSAERGLRSAERGLM